MANIRTESVFDFRHLSDSQIASCPSPSSYLQELNLKEIDCLTDVEKRSKPDSEIKRLKVLQGIINWIEKTGSSPPSDLERDSINTAHKLVSALKISFQREEAPQVLLLYPQVFAKVIRYMPQILGKEAGEEIADFTWGLVSLKERTHIAGLPEGAEKQIWQLLHTSTGKAGEILVSAFSPNIPPTTTLWLGRRLRQPLSASLFRVAQATEEIVQLNPCVSLPQPLEPDIEKWFALRFPFSEKVIAKGFQINTREVRERLLIV